MDEPGSDGQVSRTDQWEYHTVRPPRESTKKEAADPADLLAELGAEGWELTETVDYVGGGTKYLLFKRPASVGETE